MALLASPVRMGPRIQGRVADAEETKGDAFASSKHKRRSLEQAPKRPRASISNPNPMNSHLQLPRRSVFEISSSPAVRQATSNHLNGKGIVGSSPQRLQKTPPQVNKVGKRIHDSAVGKVVSPHVNGQHIKESSEAPLFVTQNHRSSLPPSDEPELPGRSPLQSARLKSSGKAKGKRRLDDIEAEERTKKSLPVTQLEDVEEEMEEDFEPIAEGFNDYDVADEVYEEVYDDGDVEPTIDEVPESELEPVSISHPNRSLQLPKSNKQATQSRPPERPLKRHSPSEEDSQVESSQPTKKPRLSPVRTMLPPANPPPKASPAKRPKDRDANIKTMFGKAKSKQSAPPPQTIPSRSPPLSKSRPKGRGLQIMKDDAEPEIDGARYTRSGRTSVKPVEYWRGERIIYTEPRREGGRVSLPGIKEVIRVDEGPIPSRSKSKRKTARSQKRQVSVESEIDEIEQEWELEPGVFAGEVPSWDSIEQRGDPEYPEQVGKCLYLKTTSIYVILTPVPDLAIAPRGLELLTKEVKGATFQYAKTITLPFFHSGMVDLPPGGEKKTKNSRRNHMVFWVFSGRVIADVSGNEFSLGRGGMWQVPRGISFLFVVKFTQSLILRI